MSTKTVATPGLVSHASSKAPGIRHRRTASRLRLRGRSGSSVDSLLLAAVKIVTLASTMANTMILSHMLSLRDFGTYAQGVLLVQLVADLVILGLLDAVNFFFAKKGQNRLAHYYINACFFLQTLVGLGAALVLVVLRGSVAGYFGNPALTGLVGYVALRPMLTNMTGMFQVLIVAIGRAKAIAIRNLVFAALKFVAVVLTALVTSSIAVLFLMLLALDVLSVVWFWDYFRRWKFLVRPRVPRWTRLREILAFCLPMAIYIGSGSLMRQVGALVIGANETTENYAIFSNCSAILPLDVVSLSFLTVIIPIITRYIVDGERSRALTLFRHYLAVGYHTTVTLGIAALVAAPEIIQVLYGARYLPGYAVFCLYLVVAMIRFATLTLVLTPAGRTRTLMVVSLISLATNAVLSVILYQIMGFVGPAVAAVTVMVGQTLALLRLSLRELHGSVSDAFPPRAVGLYCLTTLVTALAGLGLRQVLLAAGLPVFANAVLVFGVVSAGVIVLNRSQFSASLRAINSMS